MDGFRRMLWTGRQHSADQIPVSAYMSVYIGLPIGLTQALFGLSSMAFTRSIGDVMGSLIFVAANDF